MESRSDLETTISYYLSLTAFVEAIPDALIIINPKGCISLVNSQTETLFGYHRTELIGETIEFLMPHRFRGNQPVFRDNYFFNPKFGKMETGHELYGLKGDGTEFPLEITISPMKTAEAQFSLAAVRDISLRKKAEALEQELMQKRANEAERIQRQQEEFIYTISHEMRNPLQGIMGGVDMSTELLKKLEFMDPSSADYKKIFLELKDANKIIQQCAELGKFVADDVLNLAKMDAGKLKLEISPFNPKEVIATTLSLFSGRLSEKPIKIEIKAEKANFIIEGDEKRFRQIIVNLLSNAIKFTKSGTITISAELSATSDTQFQLNCHVIDTGIGMNEAEVKRLFAPFQQANNKINFTYGGTGLGLVICKRLTSFLGGNIEVLSKEGVGSDIHFTITLQKSSLELKPEPTPVKKSKKKLALNGCKILIVEDEVVNQKILERYITQVGCTYEIAIDGQDAVEKGINEKNNFDIILMDVSMPVMNGLEATRCIHAKQTTRGLPLTPVIGLSANVSSESIAEAKAAGMIEYLTKPYNKDELFFVLQNIFEKQKSKIAQNPLITPAQISLNADQQRMKESAIALVTRVSNTPSAIYANREKLSSLQQLEEEAKNSPDVFYV